MKTILIIDDEPSVRSVLRDFCEIHGHCVHEAGDGVVGLRACSKLSPDLILCDIHMPEMEGLETIQVLKQQHAGIPIVVMSGGSRSYGMNFLPVAQKLGAAEILSKPFDFEQLRGILQKYV